MGFTTLVNSLPLPALYFCNPKKNIMSELHMDDSFADFVNELETSEKNKNAQCSIDNPECESCSG
jgi:hypothetical protein